MKKMDSTRMTTLGRHVCLGFTFYFLFFSSAIACEKPAFERVVDLVELTSDELLIAWKPVSGADYYEFRYSVKVPEGRTLFQREKRIKQTAYRFSAAELPSIEKLQLLAEVTAQCNTIQSEPAFTQLSISRNTTACEFGKEIPTIKDGELHLPSLKEAQSYIMCTQLSDKPSACKEVNHLSSTVVVPEGAWVSIAPVCGQLQGKPVFAANPSQP
jgi:hypothetical protein